MRGASCSVNLGGIAYAVRVGFLVDALGPTIAKHISKVEALTAGGAKDVGAHSAARAFEEAFPATAVRATIAHDDRAQLPALGLAYRLAAEAFDDNVVIALTGGSKGHPEGEQRRGYEYQPPPR